MRLFNEKIISELTLHSWEQKARKKKKLRKKTNFFPHIEQEILIFRSDLELCVINKDGIDILSSTLNTAKNSLYI